MKRIVSMTAAFVLAAVCALLSACGSGSSQTHVQQLNYIESIERINNPDQGFYTPISVKVTENGVTYNKNIVTDYTQLYHLRIDISAFSSAVNGQADLPLTQSALDGIKELLLFLKTSDKNAIVRFAYDQSFNGNRDQEPSFDAMLNHVVQICPLFDGYENTVTAIEVGLIGPWGEMHTSAIANAEHITPLIDEFLNRTQNIPVLVRTPKMIYDYLGITVNDIDSYTISASSKAYRLGIFNDGYLGSESDLGTFTDRAREIEFFSKQTEHLPYGGEVVTPSSTLHDIEVCLPEMNKIHTSYMNSLWNDQVIAKWKNSNYTSACGGDEIYYGQTAFSYIENHLGYRLVLKKSTFSYSDKLDKISIELQVKNVGFGNLNRSKTAQLVFTDETGAAVLTKTVGEYSGSASVKYTTELSLESGSYDVYLRLCGEEYEGAPLYCIRFANDGLWNAVLKANKIGSISVR